VTHTVAIHQPNFFPWLGYFHKIAKSDTFIFFDNVQFPKKGGVWTNRVKLLLAAEARWLTAPINRSFHGTKNINQIYFKKDDLWRMRFQKSLDLNYRNHPFFEEIIALIRPLIKYDDDNISNYNIHNISVLAGHLGIDCSKCKKSSELPSKGESNELLCSLTKSVNGSTYLFGGGAQGYQDPTIFQNAGLNLVAQNFKHPVYNQLGAETFISGLSIIDVLMNIGIKGTRDLLF
jgi:hypothetical protein